MSRVGAVYRKTGETEIKISLELDGNGNLTGSSGLPFFDHMLHLWAKHGSFNLHLEVKGDLEVDGHHTVEDIGIVLGQALTKALGDKSGITRYGHIILPMDEALVLVALDISGRPYLSFDVELPNAKLGTFDSELVEEFLRAFCVHAGLTLHVKLLSGKNTHHIIEGIFKALARALRDAVAIDPKAQGLLPSTKGLL